MQDFVLNLPPQASPRTLTTAERWLVEELAKLEGWTSWQVTQIKDRLFDVHIKGRYLRYGSQNDTVAFSAWLPLAALRAAVEKSQEAKKIWQESDYPEMAGDWSAIRDSSEATIWQLFGNHALAQLLGLALQ